MIKINGIEDDLLNQIMKYDGIEYFIDDFIEQARQFGMIDERRTANMRDKMKSSIDYSKMESILLNSEVKSKIKQVVVDTTRTRKKRKLKHVQSDKKEKTQLIRESF